MSHHPNLQATYTAIVNRVLGWKTILAQWQIGTRDEVGGERRALEDLREQLLRAQIKIDALTALLLQKHTISNDDLLAKKIEAATQTDQTMQQRFQGAKATDTGVQIVDEAAFKATKSSLGFPL